MYFSYSEHVAFTGLDEQRFPILCMCVFKFKKKISMKFRIFSRVLLEVANVKKKKKDFKFWFQKFGQFSEAFYR